jgi:hypothetical protein
MNFSAPVVEGLAKVWLAMHGAAAEAHLSTMITSMRRSGYNTSARSYRRILDAIGALRLTERKSKPVRRVARSASSR